MPRAHDISTINIENTTIERFVPFDAAAAASAGSAAASAAAAISSGNVLGAAAAAAAAASSAGCEYEVNKKLTDEVAFGLRYIRV